MNMTNVTNNVQTPKLKPKQKASESGTQNDFRDIMNQSAKENQDLNLEKAQEAETQKKPEISETIQKDSKPDIEDENLDSAFDQTGAISKEMMAFMNIVQPEIKQIEVINNQINLKSSDNQTLENVAYAPDSKNSTLIMAKNDIKLQSDEGSIKIEVNNGYKSDKAAPELTLEKTGENQVKIQAAQPDARNIKSVKAEEDMPDDTKIEAAKQKIEVEIESKSEIDTDKTQLNQNPKNQQIAENPEVIKVKVGDLQETSPAKFIKEISEKIYIKNAGDNEYEIQLDPENLGKIRVRVTFEQGQTNVSLMCTSSKTLSLLSENMAGLSQLIQDNTRNAVTVNVQEDSYLNHEQNQGNKQQQSQQNKENNRDNQNPEFADQIKLGLWEIENLKKQFQMSSY